MKVGDIINIQNKPFLIISEVYYGVFKTLTSSQNIFYVVENKVLNKDDEEYVKDYIFFLNKHIWRNSSVNAIVVGSSINEKHYHATFYRDYNLCERHEIGEYANIVIRDFFRSLPKDITYVSNYDDSISFDELI